MTGPHSLAVSHAPTRTSSIASSLKQYSQLLLGRPGAHRDHERNVLLNDLVASHRICLWVEAPALVVLAGTVASKFLQRSPVQQIVAKDIEALALARLDQLCAWLLWVWLWIRGEFEGLTWCRAGALLNRDATLPWVRAARCYGHAKCRHRLERE